VGDFKNKDSIAEIKNKIIPLFYAFMSDCQENSSQGGARFSLIYYLFEATLEMCGKLGFKKGNNLIRLCRLCKQVTHIPTRNS